MSNSTLTDAQVNLLKKGLKFTPTPKGNIPEIETDVREFCRRLRLKENFFEDDDLKSSENESQPETPLDSPEKPMVRNNSNWNPRPRRNDLLDSCIDTLTKSARQLGSHNIKSCKDNLSKQERQALQQLQNNTNIVIKEADKGGALCIMDSTFYATKMSEMLQDDTTYKQIEDAENKKVISKIRKLTEQYQHCLMTEEIEYLIQFEYKESNLYGLPKIHKSQTIKNAINQQNSEYISVISPVDLKFRPIVAGPVSPTSRLSHLVDCIIKSLPQHTKSFVRDDIHFLSRLQRTLPKDQSHVLVTLDVESLYTNIDKDLGIKAIRYWVRKLKDKVNARFSEDFICDAIKIVLEHNTFHFDDKHYLQIKGTAMGTKMAPTYANLVLAYLEDQLYEKLYKNCGQEYGKYIENHFLRYLDDCFIVWPTSKWSLEEFTTELNNLHPNLNFTQECNSSQIAFLDILVQLENNIITTDIFYKTTDTHQYLPFDSCHPRHTKHSIPYSQARRLCTIIDDEVIRDQRLEEMKHFFVERGYPPGLVDNGIQRAKQIPQSTLRLKKTKIEENVLPYVSTHNPCNPDMAPLVTSTLNVLKSDARMKKVLASTKYITSKRQPQNLRRILTKACFKSATNSEGGSKKCGDKRCGTCPHIQETEWINITTTGQKFKIKTPMNCKSKNVLYIITCKGCREQYVGMTNDTLCARVRVHKQHIRSPQYRKLGVSKHISECSSTEPKFNITPFFKISASKTHGLIKEEMFIKQFQPSLNSLSL